MQGANNLISQLASNDATISSTHNSVFKMTATGTNSMLQVAGHNALIVNDKTSPYLLNGANNLISQIASNDATVENHSLISMIATGTNSILQAAGHDTRISNDDTTTITMQGANNLISQIASHDATISSTHNSVFKMTATGPNPMLQPFPYTALFRNDKTSPYLLNGANNLISQIAGV